MPIEIIVFYAVGVSITIGVVPLIYFLSNGQSWTGRATVARILIAMSIYMLIFQICKYHSHHFYTDFSHWTGLLHNINSGRGPVNPSVEYMFPGTLNYLSVHFVPFIYIFAAVFRVFPYSETVMVLNFVFMVSAAIPLYMLASTILQNKRISLFIVVLFLWYPTFQYIVLYEFEILRFSIPVLLWMLYFWERRKRGLFFLFALLAILVREEIGLTIMMFGLYAIIIDKRRTDGLLTSLLGLAGFMIVAQLVMPSMRTTGNYEHIAAASFGDFGTSPGEVILNILKHPGSVLRAVFQTTKLANILMLFLPLMFVPLMAPFVLMSMAANLGVGLLSNSMTHTSYMMYYVSPSIPFIFYAFIKGWPRLLCILEVADRRLGKVVRDNNGTAIACICGAMFIANIFFGPSPISLQFWFRDLRPAPFRTHSYHHSAYHITDHHRKVESFCSLIPDSAVVSAEQFLCPRLFTKRGIMVFPQLKSIDGKTRADYVFIDKTNPVKTGVGAVPGSWDGLRKNPQAYYDLVEKEPQSWELIRADDGYYLYRRVEKDVLNSE